MVILYKNGQDFYNDNKNLIENNIIRTIFFKLNSFVIDSFTREDFAIKIIDDDSKNELIAINKTPYNLLIFGDKSLIKELVSVVFYNNLVFNGLQCDKILADEFVKEYLLLASGDFNSHLDMNLLTYNKKLSNCNKIDYSNVLECNDNDIDQIFNLCLLFDEEALGRVEVKKESIINNITNFRCVKDNEKIVSMALKSRNQDTCCAISYVYTSPKYRGLGYAKKIVSKIRDEIVYEKKTPYLNVDNNNPISSHIYYSIGFEKLENTINNIYNEGNIKRALFAGGCFWCLANNFYNVNGVIKVISGYAGGNVVSPTYKEVKSGSTGHKESILVIYDSNIVSYEELLKIFLESIDPFDSEGQFIDRGTSYQTAVFTSDLKEKMIYYKYKKFIENKYSKEIQVPLLENTVFYLAEEEHQEFSLKYREKFLEEEIVSGRKDFKNIKL